MDDRAYRDEGRLVAIESAVRMLLAAEYGRDASFPNLARLWFDAQLGVVHEFEPKHGGTDFPAEVLVHTRKSFAGLLEHAEAFAEVKRKGTARVATPHPQSRWLRWWTGKKN